MPSSAWIAHAYTASGAVLAFLAMRDAIAGDLRGAFLALFAATIVDTTDGWVARRLRVRERLPWFDGSKLDDIVDYLTYVFVPAFLLYHAGRLPARWGALVACAMLLASAYGFSRADAKTRDDFFTGFPSYWNVAAFYLVAADVAPLASGVLLLILCGMVFVPVAYVYPSRTSTLMKVTVTFCGAWGALVLALIWRLPAPPRGLVAISLAFPIYYTALSLMLDRRRRAANRRG